MVPLYKPTLLISLINWYHFCNLHRTDSKDRWPCYNPSWDNWSSCYIMDQVCCILISCHKMGCIRPCQWIFISKALIRHKNRRTSSRGISFGLFIFSIFLFLIVASSCIYLLLGLLGFSWLFCHNVCQFGYKWVYISFRFHVQQRPYLSTCVNMYSPNLSSADQPFSRDLTMGMFLDYRTDIFFPLFS